MTKEEVSDTFVKEVERKIGMSSNGWDLVDPKELIANIINVAFPYLAEWSGKQALDTNRKR